jgi:hypothetical protein
MIRDEKKKQKIKSLLHIKPPKSYKIRYGFNFPNPRGRISGSEEIIKAKTAEDALSELKLILRQSGIVDYYIISVESTD